jgi:HK97 gp10 family phage protein
MSDVRIKGLSELQGFLDALPAKIEMNVMRGALRAGVKPVLEEIRTTAPVDSGALRDSMKVSTSARSGVVRASVRTKLFYARFIEYGAAAHRIVGKPHGALRFGDTMVQSVDHPGIAPRPFMRPALDTQAQAAVVATGEYIKKRLASRHGLDTADVTIEADE